MTPWPIIQKNRRKAQLCTTCGDKAEASRCGICAHKHRETNREHMRRKRMRNSTLTTNINE